MLTEVRLGQKDASGIDRFLINAGGVLEAEQGGMLFDHDTAKAGATNVAIRSPFGLIAIRGTRFFAGPSNGVFGVFVQRGSVMVVGAYQAVIGRPAWAPTLRANTELGTAPGALGRRPHQRGHGLGDVRTPNRTRPV